MRVRIAGIPLPSGLYYGWVIVGVSLLGNVAVVPLNPVIFSFFLAPMSDDLGWSRSTLSWALTLRLVMAGLTAPVIGVLIDRFGSRWVGVLAALVAGLSIAALSSVNHLWFLFLLFAVSGGVGLGGGPGANLLLQVPVAKWFVTKRGRAMAISTVGLAGGTFVAIPVGQWLIETYGWREAWVVFGILVPVLLVPLFGIFMRRAPEDFGLLPDGAPAAPETQATTEPGVATETDWTVAQAVRTPTLWIVLIAFALLGAALSGTLVHRVAFWQDIGMSPRLVAIGTAMDPLTVVFSALVFGVVGERVHPRYLALVGGVGFALSMLPMVFATDHAYVIFAHNITWGAAAGAWVTANNLIWPIYFGRRYLGAIRGLVLPVIIGGTGLGAPIYGYLLDSGMSAALVWTISLVLFVNSAVMVLLAKQPKLTTAQLATA